MQNQILYQYNKLDRLFIVGMLAIWALYAGPLLGVTPTATVGINSGLKDFVLASNRHRMKLSKDIKCYMGILIKGH
jgi:hypothetical protein